MPKKPSAETVSAMTVIRPWSVGIKVTLVATFKSRKVKYDF